MSGVLVFACAACGQASEPDRPQGATSQDSSAFSFVESETMQIRYAVGGVGGQMALSVIDVGGPNAGLLLVGSPEQIEAGVANRIAALEPGAVFNTPVWIDETRIAAERSQRGGIRDLVVIDIQSGELQVWPTTIGMGEEVLGATKDGLVLIRRAGSPTELEIVAETGSVRRIELEPDQAVPRLCDDGSIVVADTGPRGQDWSISRVAPTGEVTTFVSAPEGNLRGLAVDPTCGRILLDASFNSQDLPAKWLIDTSGSNEPQELNLEGGEPTFVGASTVATLGTDGIQLCDLPCT